MLIATITTSGGALLAGSAWAQPQATPDQSAPQNTISMTVGQAQQLKFPEPFDQVRMSSETVVAALPVTDHLLTLQGLAAGETIMTVLAGGKTLYSAVIAVSSEPGHLVRIYGTGKNDDANAGHVAVFCDPFGCGRPDKDMPTPTISIERFSRGPMDRR